ncbi:MAG TPA: CGNR zinc finger domain-containing protein [Chloroflexota bacterium]|nr:CGNR zinc finger domain-containing protein [Chloroflexota bacterium]
MSTLEEAFPLEGGWLCLGFCNTVGWHSGAYRRADLYSAGQDTPHDWERDAAVPGAHERFSDYRSLVRWFWRKGQLTLSEVKALLRTARAQPEAAEGARRRAIGLREGLYHLFRSLAAEGEAPDERDVAALNAWLPEAMARRRLALAGGHFTWVASVPAGELEGPLWPVVWSAVELLTAGPLDRVRECDNDPCGWLFVDSSRNRSRRWCDMRDCGNRVKARRHYARTRGAKAAG